MRDKETDSWWSIMESKAIDGELSGRELVQRPEAEKTTWGQWRRRHPTTLVLEVDGKTHLEENAYAEYLEDPEKTYRDAVPEDDRLPAKEPIFAFRTPEGAFAIAHVSAEGGLTFATEPDLNLNDSRVILYRAQDAPLLASTRAYRFPKKYLIGIFQTPRTLLERIEDTLEAGLGEEEGVSVVRGIDTFWYNWIAHNPDTQIKP